MVPLDVAIDRRWRGRGASATLKAQGVVIVRSGLRDRMYVIFIRILEYVRGVTWEEANKRVQIFVVHSRLAAKQVLCKWKCVEVLG